MYLIFSKLNENKEYFVLLIKFVKRFMQISLAKTLSEICVISLRYTRSCILTSRHMVRTNTDAVKGYEEVMVLVIEKKQDNVNSTAKKYRQILHLT